MTSDVTLQINLSGGDATYAETTVPPLVAAHRAHVGEVLGIVDCCRPQKTQMVDPDVRFPWPVFNERLERIRAIAEGFRQGGIFDRVVYVEPGDPRIALILRKYVGRLITETHDCYGVGLVSYLYGFEECTTRYLLHYDADMLLFQEAGFDWSVAGRRRLLADPRAISATPRVSPPFAAALGVKDSPSLQATSPELQAEDGVWRIGWFSARCYLIDLERLGAWLPLLDWRTPRYLCAVVARKLLARGYPPPTEMLIHVRGRQQGSYRLDLTTERAFVIHPNDKSERFLRMLPGIVESVSKGHVPSAQRGWENLLLDVWPQRFPGCAESFAGS
jgi:hypothetical protein